MVIQTICVLYINKGFGEYHEAAKGEKEAKNWKRSEINSPPPLFKDCKWRIKWANNNNRPGLQLDRLVQLEMSLKLDMFLVESNYYLRTFDVGFLGTDQICFVAVFPAFRNVNI